MGALLVGLTQGIDDIDLAAAIRGEILDQKRAGAFDDFTFYLSIASEPFGFLANILHR